MAQMTEALMVVNDSMINGVFFILKVQVAFLICFLAYKHIKERSGNVKKKQVKKKMPNDINPVKNDVFSVSLKK